jgi:hypothetical protein
MFGGPYICLLTNADKKGPRSVLGPSAKPRNDSKQSLLSIDNGASSKV